MKSVEVGIKHDEGKPDLSLLPYSALEAWAKAKMVGERKYGRYNYRKGMAAGRLVAAAMRHLGRWYWFREDFDPVDGQSHLGSVMANIGMIIDQQLIGTLTDDRPEIL